VSHQESVDARAGAQAQSVIAASSSLNDYSHSQGNQGYQDDGYGQQQQYNGQGQGYANGNDQGQGGYAPPQRSATGSIGASGRGKNQTICVPYFTI
jgi:hypothetical protein